MKVAYRKMHGTGNRILVVDQRADGLPPPRDDRIVQLADQLGFDQLMWVQSSDTHAAAYRIFNADGSEVGQCGNGVRCVASVLAQDANHPQSFTLASPAGPVQAIVDDDGLVAVSMGAPEFEPAAIPFIAPAQADRYDLEVDGVHYDICAVSMGNPHCVLQVDSVERAPVRELGPRIEVHERFPGKANVGFVRFADRDRIELRVHERGVGETAACGTGACAAVVSGQRLGLLDTEVSVRLPGGQVVVSWRGGAEPVWLTGNAELIAEGFLEL